MLPLWIIDITESSVRQEHFCSLVDKLGCVVTQRSLPDFLQGGNGAEPSKIKKQWYYSRMEDTFRGVDASDVNAMAEAVYLFQENMVKEGQNFVRILRRTNIDSSTILNVCVIADVTEKLTQYVFPSLAIMLQKEKERILPNHIHQGMSIVGMPYLPSEVNNLSAKKRQSILLTIKEIEIQHNITSVRGYDRMFIYQDVQNRTENYYPQLDEKGVAEYLFQCLIHLYYACDKVHPLISGGSSDESFYFSLGVSSLFYDIELQDVHDNQKVCEYIVEQLVAKGDNAEEVDWEKLMDFGELDPMRMVERFSTISFDLSKAKLSPPSPHPVRNFLHNKLKSLYYGKYLRYYPANLRLKQLESILSKSERVLLDIASVRKRMQENMETAVIPSAVERQLATCSTRVGVLTQIEESFKTLKVSLGKKKSFIKKQIADNIWGKLVKDNVPEKLTDDFDRYHESYLADCESGNSRLCQELWESATADFVNKLKQEATFSGRLVRVFMLSVLASIAVLLALRSFDALSAPIVGVVCGLCTLFSLLVNAVDFFVYRHSREVKKRKLTAYFLHDSYVRIANRIQNEMTLLYDNVMDLCDEYVKRCRVIRDNIHVSGSDNTFSEMEIPVSRFNQPIMGGEFCGKVIIPFEEQNAREIYVNRVPTRINELDKEDVNILIHQYKSVVMKLFNGVRLPNLPRRTIVNTDNEAIDEAEWNKQNEMFLSCLRDCVGKDFLPMRNPTIGEQLRFFSSKSGKCNVLEPVILFAATNGELTCSADRELADIKANLSLIGPLFEPFLPKNTTQYQFDEHTELFEKYIFITRWRTYNVIFLNRVLPTEDFDPEMMEERVNKEERILLKNKPSSFILWSVCKEDNSKEWLKLFEANSFMEARAQRDVYRIRLNTKD